MNTTPNVSVIKENDNTFKSTKGSSLLIMLLLFNISGNPAIFFGLPPQPFLVFFAIFLFFLMVGRNINFFSIHSTALFSFFAVILIYQTYSFSFFSGVTFIGFFIRLFIAYAVVLLVKDFARTYVDIIYALALWSFLFYIPQQIGNLVGISYHEIFRPIELIFGEPARFRMSLIFHSFMTSGDSSYRNAGLFWEPGAFAGFLNVGIIFLAVVRKQYDNRDYWKRLIVLLLCLLSTFSTTGYIAFILALILHLPSQKETVIEAMLKIIMSVYLIAIGAMLFYTFAWELPFMKEKIIHSFFITENQLFGWEDDRIGTIVFDYDYVRERPFTGWGLHSETRHALHPFLKGVISTGRGNGMSDFTAKMGLPALFLWMYFVFKYLFIIFGRNLIRGGIALLCIMIVLNGECYLNNPLFLCFFFLSKSQLIEQSDLVPIPVADNQLLVEQAASHSSRS